MEQVVALRITNGLFNNDKNFWSSWYYWEILNTNSKRHLTFQTWKYKPAIFMRFAKHWKVSLMWSLFIQYKEIVSAIYQLVLLFLLEALKQSQPKNCPPPTQPLFFSKYTIGCGSHCFSSWMPFTLKLSPKNPKKNNTFVFYTGNWSYNFSSPSP